MTGPGSDLPLPPEPNIPATFLVEFKQEAKHISLIFTAVERKGLVGTIPFQKSRVLKIKCVYGDACYYVIYCYFTQRPGTSYRTSSTRVTVSGAEETETIQNTSDEFSHGFMSRDQIIHIPVI